MASLYCTLCALTVAVIFYLWRDYHAGQEGRQKLLRERVAYMLWVMANGE
jgi:hypothetical protein